MSKNQKQNNGKTSRREFLQTSALAAGSLLAGTGCSRAFSDGSSGGSSRKPNILFITADQLSIDAISAHGCKDVKTPNIDRLIQRGVTFKESYSTHPVCSPARSSWYTGRMPVETGVIENNRAIHASRPSMGQWFQKEGYEAVYCGKWHLAGAFPLEIPGFKVLPTGATEGHLNDTAVAHSCEAYLKNRAKGKPFVLAANFVQPHDICFWANCAVIEKEIPYKDIERHYPNLAPNHLLQLPEPEGAATLSAPELSVSQWRYYNYVYFRQIEMLDADVGRVLDALESTGESDNTIIVFTADHGEGRGRHGKAGKWNPYDEASKVPLVVSWPGSIEQGLVDDAHLVSGIDIMPTICDLAGIPPPPLTTALSVRPLLEKKATDWREFVVVEYRLGGRAVRTADFKYIEYANDPQRMLFDRKADPWEMKNLINDARYGQTIADHQKLLADWNARMDVVEPSPKAGGKRQAPAKG